MTTTLEQKTDLSNIAALGQRSLAYYGLLVHRTEDGKVCEPQPHHLRWVEALEDESIKNLLIISPPGSAKTYWVGVFYPCWAIGNNPNLHVGYITNADDTSVKRSMAVRDTIGLNKMYQAIFPKIRPDPSKGWGQQNWYVWRERPEDKDPTFQAAGLFGSILGARYDLLIVDDICTQENTSTQLQRDKTWDWFNQTLRSRLTPNGRIVVIMTRWHHDDLAARLLEQGWPLLKTEALEPDGSSYWPEFWPLERLIDRRDGPEQEDGRRLGGIGTRAFESQYQGNPTSEIGNIFQWFEEYETPPQMRFTLHFWDTAYSKKETADYSACAHLGLGIDNEIYLLNVRQDRLDFPDLCKAIRAVADYDKATYIFVENKASGASAVQQIKQQTLLPIREVNYKNSADKIARANAVAPYFESGRVKFPHRALWKDWVVEQLKRFPHERHDDAVDAIVGGILQIVEKLGRGRPPPISVRWA